MTVSTTLDARSYFCAIWVQNELRSQRLMLPVRIGLVAVVLLVTFLLLPFRDGTAWVIRIVLIAVALVAHSMYAKRARRRVFAESAEKTIEGNGGPVSLEYRFEDDGFSMKKSGEAAAETAYSAVSRLCETPDVLLLLVGDRVIHAVHKSDVGDLPALQALLSEKTGCAWKKYMV